MKKLPTDQATNALRLLGLDIAEEQVYRTLLLHEGTTNGAIAKRLRCSPGLSQRLLRALERKGLATQSTDRVPIYSAVAPDLAAEVLIAQRQNELHQARVSLTALRDTVERKREKRRSQERVVEMMTPETAGHLFAQLFRTSVTDIVCLERLPMLVPASNKPDENYMQCLARGVRCRAITDTELLNVPGTMDRLRTTSAAGEQYRTMSNVPFKLLIFDRRVAIIPLDLSRPDGPVLLVRSSSLLDALYEMFDLYWRLSMPFVNNDPRFDADSGAGSSVNRDHELLSLLAHGLNDKAVQHELKLSARTVARRIAELALRLGATTRFQAGWLAALAAQAERTAVRR